MEVVKLELYNTKPQSLGELERFAGYLADEEPNQPEINRLVAEERQRK
jgi:hypothetical protein